MNKRYFCTSCFKEDTYDDIVFECNNINKSGRRKTHSKPVQFKYSLNPIINNFPEKAICPVCRKNTSIKYCGDCGKPLVNPETIKMVSITGAKGSGKTVYISKLYEEIINTFQKAFPVTVTQTIDSEINYENNYKITTGDLLPEATQVGVKKPLILNIKNKKNKEINLVFYDSAGEDFERTNKNFSEHVKHLEYTSLIIMLVDILQIDWVRNNVETEQLKTHSIGKSNTHVLNTIIENYRLSLGRSTNLNKNYKIKTPIAVSLSLVDILKDKYNDPTIKYLIESDHVKRGAFVPISFSTINNGVKDFLNDHENGFLKNVERHFKTKVYFSISSLGGQPRDNITISNNPINVLDPIIWLLKKEKFI